MSIVRCPHCGTDFTPGQMSKREIELGLELEKSLSRIWELEAALREIARQMTTREMSKEELDIEGAYNALIGIARATLAPEQSK